MSSPSPIIVEGLTKSYGSVTVLSGVDFEVPAGACLALLGPNGAGKTTTVEILEAYRRRDAGRVEVLGVDPQKPTSSWRGRIGIVLQEASDNAELTVVETLRFFASLYQRSRPLDELLDMVGLAQKADARTSTLSGGQRRRLDVALGIVGFPEVLFLDEPTTGFDPEARRQFWELIRGLRTEGTTILLTTHYLDEVEALADEAVVIAAGRVRASGPPATLGGRATAESLIRFKTRSGDWFEERTRTPTQRVAELHAQIGELEGLSVTHPTLEDVYLDLINDESAGEST